MIGLPFGTPVWLVAGHTDMRKGVASVCFIQALKGLSHPTTSIRGNMFGMASMAIAVVTTGALIVDAVRSEPAIRQASTLED